MHERRSADTSTFTTGVVRIHGWEEKRPTRPTSTSRFSQRRNPGRRSTYQAAEADQTNRATSLSCEFIMQGWEDMIPNLNADRYDAIVSSMSKSEERMKLVDFTDSYYTSPSVFVIRKKTEMPDFQSKSLGGLALGVTLGTCPGSLCRTDFPDAEVTIFPSSPELYKGLADGSIYVVFEDKLAIYDWLTNTRAGRCCEFKCSDIIDPKFFGDGAGIVVRKTDTELQEKLNFALVTITPMERMMPSMRNTFLSSFDNIRDT